MKMQIIQLEHSKSSAADATRVTHKSHISVTNSVTHKVNNVVNTGWQDPR